MSVKAARVSSESLGTWSVSCPPAALLCLEVTGPWMGASGKLCFLSRDPTVTQNPKGSLHVSLGNHEPALSEPTVLFVLGLFVVVYISTAVFPVLHTSISVGLRLTQAIGLSLVSEDSLYSCQPPGRSWRPPATTIDCQMTKFWGLETNS